MFNEFRKFILRGNVVDLAVGIVIGAAFTSVVNAFVRDVVNPLMELFYHGEKFSKLAFSIGGSTFNYGDLLNNLLSFLIVAAVIFFLVVQPINRISERFASSKDTGEATTRKCPYCLGKIPTKATRCMHCTSKISKKT
ncbi:MAG: large conductance mechanosensitive channel protein MscL [Candidatus Saccharimonadales bacterium]